MKDYEINEKVEVCFGVAKKLLDAGLAVRINPYDNEFDIYDKTTTREYDVDFFLNIAKELGGSVLDIGCGEGRLLIPMLRAGISVDGIDNSQRMIQKLNSKVRGMGYGHKTRIQLMDMREIEIAKKYKLIILSFGAIGYLKDDMECKKIFNMINNMLEIEGRFVFDFDPNYGLEGEEGPFLSQQIVNQEDGEIIIRTVQTKGIDYERRVTNIIDYIIKDTKVDIAVEATVEKKYSYDNIIKSLKENGFLIEYAYGDYSYNLYKKNVSEECIIVAKNIK
jgi:SAM-dependent methyltransferase